MKLYSKQLKSIEDLRREKHVMRYAVKHSDEMLSFKELGGADHSTSDAAGAGLAGTLISAVGSKSLTNTLLAIAPPILTMLSKRSGRRQRKNPLESLAKEVFLGYVKWKAIQMVYRGVMLAVKSKKDEDKKERH